jgi:hypothetical protein
VSIGWGLGPDHTCRSTGLSSFLLRWAAWCSTMGTHRIQFERTVSYGVPGQGQSCGDGVECEGRSGSGKPGSGRPVGGWETGGQVLPRPRGAGLSRRHGSAVRRGGAGPDHDRVARLRGPGRAALVRAADRRAAAAPSARRGCPGSAGVCRPASASFSRWRCPASATTRLGCRPAASATTAQLGRRAAATTTTQLGCGGATTTTTAAVTTGGRVGTWSRAGTQPLARAQPPVRDASVQTWAYSAVIRSMRCSTSGRRSAHALIPTSSRP